MVIRQKNLSAEFLLFLTLDHQSIGNSTCMFITCEHFSIRRSSKKYLPDCNLMTKRTIRFSTNVHAVFVATETMYICLKKKWPFLSLGQLNRVKFLKP